MEGKRIHTACKLWGGRRKRKTKMNCLKNATMKLTVSMIMKMFTNLESFQGYNIKGRTIFFYNLYIIISIYFEKMCFLMCIIFKLCVLRIWDVHVHPQRSEGLEPLQVESQAPMSPLMQVLGPKLKSCTREVQTTTNH